jgi:predicted metalloprotease
VETATAYVIAHEIGHHVQTLLGTSDKTNAEGKSQTEANKLSVALELQADFYAGVDALQPANEYYFRRR